MPLFFFIHRFAASCAVFAFATGCAPNAALIPPGERMRLADAAVSEAVAAYNKGDLGRGDVVLNRAVILLTDTVSGGFSDAGYIAVAKRIGAEGRPQDAIRLLEPLTSDKRVAWDPLLWATLAQSATQASDLTRATEAQARAKTEADTIIAGFGGTVPGQTAAIKSAERATRAGQYFDQYAKNHAKALLAYREAYRLLPGDPLTANNLGYILADHGTTPDDFAEAVRLTRGVVEKMPDQPVFLDSFGWALFKRGDSAQNDLAGARRRLREAVDLAPDMPELHLHLAAVYEALNKLPDALREAEIAAQLASAPDDIAARTLRDRLKPLVAPPSPSASPIETQQARPQEP